MKNLAKIALMGFAALALTVASCDSKPAEKAGDAAEETMDAAGAEIDSATSPSKDDTAVVRDQPTEGLVDSLENP